MKMYELIFGIFTILGTLISICQACKAKKYADIAVDAKNSVLEKKQLGIFNNILNRAHDVETVLKSWKNNRTTKQGRNIAKDADKIDDFVSLVNEQKQNFPDSYKSGIEKNLSSTITYLKDFRDDSKDRAKTAELLHGYVRNIISVVATCKQDNEYK